MTTKIIVTMKPKTLKKIKSYPKVITWNDFDKENIHHILRVSSRLQKYLEEERTGKLKRWVSFCIKQWGDLNNTPLSRPFLQKVITFIEMW